jgi:phage terminase large subunit GpA-like protein
MTSPWLSAYAEPPEGTVSAWADRHIVLDEHSAEPGRYRTERTPYVREWQDSAGLAWVHQVTIQASTQVGKTQAQLNVLGFAIAQDPGPITWVMPTREDAAEFGENRVQPMIDVSPTLRAQLTDERFDAKKRQIRFRRCRMLFRSSVTPKELAQYPARWLFADEAGKWRLKTQGEAAPFDLARERTRTFWNHKIYLTSTPTVDTGLVSIEFERGDRRRYHVPCPHCGEFQILIWKRVQWDGDTIDTEPKMRAARDAWYECEHCSKRILDVHKRDMLARGWWCPEGVDPKPHLVEGRLVLPNDRAPHRSYHIWAGYSPWLAWWEIVAEWLRSKDNPTTLQNFINSWLGEAWVEKVEEASSADMRARVGGYRRGEVPQDVRVITAAVDVQKRFLAFTVRGWGLDMDSWLLDHGRCGEFSQLADLLFAKPWPRGLRVKWVFMDTNYRTRECIAFAKKHPQIKLCRGVEFDDPVPMKAMPVERHPHTGKPIGNLKAWHINVCMFKDELAGSVRGAQGFGRFHVYDDVDATYLEEMASEHKTMIRTPTTARERWVKKAGHLQNHYWDTECYNRALAFLIGVPQMRGQAPARRHRQGERRAAEGLGMNLFGGERA